MVNGWIGNILRVNFMIGNIIFEDFSKFKSFVGGMGFGYKIMYDEVLLGMKFFDEVNKLVFVIGLLIGFGVFCSFCVNIILFFIFIKGNLVVDVYMGGFFVV